jgi:hypothetical protein
MKISVDVDIKTFVPETNLIVREAIRETVRDVAVKILHHAITHTPVLTHKNQWSLSGEVSGMGLVATGGNGRQERIVDDSELEGAVYSTSGYGGYLEVGTCKMKPRPYIRPGADLYFTEDAMAKGIKGHLP